MSFFIQAYSFLTKIEAENLKRKIIKEDGAQKQTSAICMRASDLSMQSQSGETSFKLIALQVTHKLLSMHHKAITYFCCAEVV